VSITLEWNNYRWAMRTPKLLSPVLRLNFQNLPRQKAEKVEVRKVQG
jgi:hypothetical protein